MDSDWSVTRITRERKDTAWKQLGTSGSGNHFVEFGVLTLAQDDKQLGLKAGEYVALLSHSGSRGAGAAVCSTYSQIAQASLAEAVQGSRPAGVARPRQRSRPGVLAGDESHGRLRGGESRGDPSAGGERWGRRSLPAWRTITTLRGRNGTRAAS